MRKKKLILQGLANYTGFVVTYEGKIVKSKNYKSKKQKIKLYSTEIFTICLMNAWAILLAVVAEIERISLLGRIIILMPIAFAMTLFIKNSFERGERKRKNELAEWHATEHMTISLLRKNLAITLENLQKQPMVSPNCGAFNSPLKSPSIEKLEEALEVARQVKKLIQNK